MRPISIDVDVSVPKVFRNLQIASPRVSTVSSFILRQTEDTLAWYLEHLSFLIEIAARSPFDMIGVTPRKN